RDAPRQVAERREGSDHAGIEDGVQQPEPCRRRGVYRRRHEREERGQGVRRGCEDAHGDEGPPDGSRTPAGCQEARNDDGQSPPHERHEEVKAEQRRDRRLLERHARPPASGSWTSTRRPPCGPGPAAMRPPCASTVRLAIARPSPVPSGLSEKNGSNRRGSASGGTPGPLSPSTSLAWPLTPTTSTE